MSRINLILDSSERFDACLHGMGKTAEDESYFDRRRGSHFPMGCAVAKGYRDTQVEDDEHLIKNGYRTS